MGIILRTQIGFAILECSAILVLKLFHLVLQEALLNEVGSKSRQFSTLYVTVSPKWCEITVIH